VGIDACRLWSVAGYVESPYTVAVEQTRAGYFRHLLTLGLFSIAGNRGDFFARLVSRAAAGGRLEASPRIDDLPFEPKLLVDSAHQSARAIADYLGRPLVEAEKAALFARLWLDGHRQHQLQANDYLLRDESYTWLERLVREGRVAVHWSDTAADFAPTLRALLKQQKRTVRLLCIAAASLQASRRGGDLLRSFRPMVGSADVVVIVYGELSELITGDALETSTSNGDGSIEVSQDDDLDRVAEQIRVTPITADALWPAALVAAAIRHRQALLDRADLPAMSRQTIELLRNGAANDDPLWPQWCERLLSEPAEVALVDASALAMVLGLSD
jgi:hypothetical protein